MAQIGRLEEAWKAEPNATLDTLTQPSADEEPAPVALRLQMPSHSLRGVLQQYRQACLYGWKDRAYLLTCISKQGARPVVNSSGWEASTATAFRARVGSEACRVRGSAGMMTPTRTRTCSDR